MNTSNRQLLYKKKDGKEGNLQVVYAQFLLTVLKLTEQGRGTIFML